MFLCSSRFRNKNNVNNFLFYFLVYVFYVFCDSIIKTEQKYILPKSMIYWTCFYAYVVYFIMYSIDKIEQMLNYYYHLNEY